MSNETLILKSAVATNSDIAITDLPFANVDALEGAKHFQNESFEGVKTFKSAKTGATAFGTATVKGDEVPIVIGSGEIYDEQFKYGIYVDGQIKTADEIFAPDQDGNYDISDYPDIPVTTLLERIETFPAGSNNTIRINKDTAAKYVEGFIINDVEWLPENSGVSNVYKNYSTGSFAVGDTFNEVISNSAQIKGGKVELLPGDTITIKGNGGNVPRKYCVVIGGVVNKIAPNNDSAIFVYTAAQQCIVYFNLYMTVQIHEVSATLTKKLDYVVAQANAKGYDVTIANNESDIKLIEKVKFSKENPLCREYIDTGIDINNFNSNSVHIKTEVQPVINNHSMYLVQTFDDTTNGIGLYIYKGTDTIYRFYNYSGTTKRVYNPTFDPTFVLLRNIYEIKQSELYINNVKSNTSSVPTSYTVSSDTTIRLGIRDITQLTNSTYFNGYMFNVIINDNTFIPANNGTTDGMVNLKDMSFHPLISIN